MASTASITLVAGSSHPLWLRGFLDLASSIRSVRVIGSAENADALLDLLQQRRPDVLVIDASFVAPLREFLPCGRSAPRILIAGRQLHAGTRPTFGASCACGYFSERELVAKITTLVGEVARCKLPHAGLPACQGCPVPRTFDAPQLPLTGREHEIFVRIGWGLGPSEIAAELGVHVKTIETHRESMKRKLGLSSAAELLDAAFKWRDGELLAGHRAQARGSDSA